ncbi:uncharacterized protein KGF55_004434 [Candida pseudojiufengensis]|uniref:uncharacterized protein n=1 Tax=Candida pseudojiufengensis TaxID=497109 RepID=UPI0022240EEC|nr:uncharacterized protein KGF55_004434 [Candida pseudojiufengensis]KAI5960541.1 hypothetical protein KGF55_004434 [Candida pseudojiufengensis]
MQLSSILATTIALLSTTQAGYVDYTTKCCEEDSGITTFADEFALGVKLCDSDDIYVVFEIEDGQLEVSCDTYDCSSCYTEPPCYTTTPCAEPTPIVEKPKDKYKKPKGIDYKPKDKYGKKHNKRGDSYKYKYKYNDAISEKDLCYPHCTVFDECYDYFTLCDSKLYDYRHFLGEIVANHQFQFDEHPQPDALYNKGWSIVYKDGYYELALNGCTDFWECPVNDYGLYKLYDKSIDIKCKPVEIIIIFKKCD